MPVPIFRRRSFAERCLSRSFADLSRRHNRFDVGSFSQTLVVGLMVGSNPSSATFDLSGQAVLPNPESIFVDGFEGL